MRSAQDLRIAVHGEILIRAGYVKTSDRSRGFPMPIENRSI